MTTSLGGYRPAATGISGLKGTGYKGFSIPAFNPQQQQLFSQLFSHVSPDSQLAKLAGGDQSQFEQMEAPAWRDLAAAQGGIASRFSGMGGTGAQRSSGFQNTIGSLGSDFAQRLQANRLALQRQAMQDLFGMSESLLNQRPTDNYAMPEQRPWWQELIGGGLGTGIGAATGGFGGLWGAKKLGLLGEEMYGNTISRRTT